MYVYLLATLPGFTLDDPPPMTVGDLVDRCRGFLDDAALGLLADPEAAAEGTGAAAEVARRWRDGERQLVNAVARRRAARWNLPVETSQRPHRGFRVDVEDSVARAFEAPDPKARARALDGIRWRLLEDLARTEPWGLAALFAYTARLRLAAGWAARTEDAGRAALEDVLNRIEVHHG